MKSNVILVGPIGSGKSWCTRTLLKEYPDANGRTQKGAGKEIFYLALEPGWAATNGDLTCDMGFHVHEHLPYSVPIEDHVSWLESIASKNAADIREMKLGAAIKLPFTESYMRLFVIMNGFICDNCGKNFGPASAWIVCPECDGKTCKACNGTGKKFVGWGDDKAIVVDGLTGLNKMSVHFAVGPKPTLNWPDIDHAQHLIDDMIGRFVSIQATFVLIAHWAREPREVEGGTAITVDTIGQKQAPKVLLPFDEIIVCRRDVDKYTWNMVDVDNMHVDQKARRLPYKTNINPSFTEIFGEDHGHHHNRTS